MNKTSLSQFIKSKTGNTKKNSKDILSKVKVKKRKPNDTLFGTRRGEGGLPVGFGVGLSFSSSGDGGTGDGGGMGESVEPNVINKPFPAFYSDQSNPGDNDTVEFEGPEDDKTLIKRLLSLLTRYLEDEDCGPECEHGSGTDYSEVPSLAAEYEEEQEDNTDGEDTENFDYDEVDDLEDIDNDSEESNENPNKAGLIRRVQNAHLVYKKQTPDGSYEELWIYNTDNMKDEIKIKREILSGTDIPNDKTSSDDGSQSYDLWTVGNVQMLNVKGLPN